MRCLLLSTLLLRFASALPSPYEIAAARSRASTPRLTPAPLSDLPPALQQYLSALHASMLRTTPRAGGSALTAQDCAAYALAYERALRLLPSRAPNRDVWDALRLGPDCGSPPPPAAASLGLPAPWPRGAPAAPLAGPTFYVAPGGSDSAAGTEAAPFASIGRGVSATRAARAPGTGPAAVVLRAGVHVLGATVDLDARDAGLTISAAPGEAAWVSGGVAVGPLSWAPVNVSAASGANVWAATVPSPPTYMTGLNTVGADGAPEKRLYRAQFPNFNPEWHATAACGGGARAAAMPECASLAAASPLLRHLGNRIAAAGGDAFEAAGGPRGVRDPSVLAWVPPPAHFPRPQTFFKDLKGLGLKNDSAMDGYNLYSAGRGGACGLWTDAWPADSSVSFHANHPCAPKPPPRKIQTNPTPLNPTKTVRLGLPLRQRDRGRVGGGG
jgi:hypothetical protein